jgi:FkbM family methyltransferase
MTLLHGLRKWLWKRGVDVSRVTPATNGLARRKKLLADYAIDRVLDVGANEGQYALELRNELGFTGDILSFEPLSKAFQKLRENAGKDRKWSAFPYALGEANIRTDIHLAGNSVSSSLLPMLPAHLEAAPESRGIGRETIEVRTLDSLIDTACPAGARLYLKLDAQGAEGQILKGAERALARIDTLQMEMSLVPLYEGEILLDAMIRLLREKGYSLVSLEPGFADPVTGHLLQADGVFHRA